MGVFSGLFMHYAQGKGRETKFFQEHGYPKDRFQDARRIERKLKNSGLSGLELKGQVATEVNKLPPKEKPPKNLSRAIWGDTIYYGVKLWRD